MRALSHRTGQISFPAIFRTIWIVTLSISLAAVVLVGAYFGRMKDLLEQNIDERYLYRVSKMVSEMETRLEEEADKVEDLSDMVGLLKNGSDVSDLFARFAVEESREDDFISGILLLDASGIPTAWYPSSIEEISAEPAIRDIYIFTSETLGTTIHGLVEFEGFGTAIPMAHPVRVDAFRHPDVGIIGRTWSGSPRFREMNGIVIVFFDEQKFIEKFAGEHGQYYVAQPDGTVFLRTSQRMQTVKVSPFSESWDFPLEKSVIRVLDGVTGSDHVEIERERHHTTYAPVMFYHGLVNNRESLFTGDEHLFIGFGSIDDEKILLSTQTAGYQLMGAIALFGLLLLGLLLYINFLFKRQLNIEEEMHANQLNTMKETAGATAHHLFQPLTAIKGNLKMLQILLSEPHEHDPERIMELIRKIESSSLRMQDTVEKMTNILDYRTEEYVDDIRIAVFEGSTAPHDYERTPDERR